MRHTQPIQPELEKKLGGPVDAIPSNNVTHPVHSTNKTESCFSRVIAFFCSRTDQQSTPEPIVTSQIASEPAVSLQTAPEPVAWAAIHQPTCVINCLLAGKYNNTLYNSQNIFKRFVTFYPSLQEAADDGYITSDFYVLAFGYDKEKVEQLALEGQFSRTILYAVDGKQQYTADQKCMIPEKVQRIENSDFSADLLTEVKAVSSESVIISNKQ